MLASSSTNSSMRVESTILESTRGTSGLETLVSGIGVGIGAGGNSWLISGSGLAVIGSAVDSDVSPESESC